MNLRQFLTSGKRPSDLGQTKSPPFTGGAGALLVSSSSSALELDDVEAAGVFEEETGPPRPNVGARRCPLTNNTTDSSKQQTTRIILAIPQNLQVPNTK